MKVVVMKDLSIWVTQCGHGREALKISRSASKITFPVLSILRLKTLPNSTLAAISNQMVLSVFLIWGIWFLNWRTSLLIGGSGPTGEE